MSQAQILLQPVEKTVIKQAVHLQPTEDHFYADIYTVFSQPMSFFHHIFSPCSSEEGSERSQLTHLNPLPLRQSYLRNSVTKNNSFFL